MARIYIARSTGIGSFERHAVLKMILPERAHDETSVQMFLDEARLAASLNHQNVAQVFEVGKEAGIHFLAMEYVHGQDLRALLAKAGSSGTRVPLELALTVVAGAAAGLEHAHERRASDGTPMGIVHRDVSPSNIMIGYDGAVKLLDFGIAKATSRSIETQSGIIKGKFAYMAPEQCRGRDVDRRSDVFSLGIILYEVTTQHRCFRADSDFDTMHRIVTGDIVRPSRLVQGYPQALEAIVMRALSVDISQRYQSAGLLLEAVESFAAAARMPLSTVSLGRFMRDMFGDVLEPWLVTGKVNHPDQAKEQTISNTNGAGDPPRAPSPSSPPPVSRAPSSSSLPVVSRAPSSSSLPVVSRAPSSSLPAVQRAPSSSLPAVQRPSSPSAPPPAFPRSASSPAAHRPSSSSVSSPAFQRPSQSSAAPLPPAPLAPPSALPSQHELAPLHLPPDVPLELPGPEPITAEPLPADQIARGYSAVASPYPHGALASPNLPPMPPQLPSSPNALKPPLSASSPLAAQFTDASRSESGVAHGALASGALPIVKTRQGYANAPALSGSEVVPRFDPQELGASAALQFSNRVLYIGLGVLLVGIIILLAISIAADGSDDQPAPPRSAPGQRSSRTQPAPDRAHDVVAAGPGAAALKPSAVKPEAFHAEASGSDAPSSRRDSIRVHLVSIPAGAEVSLGGKPLGTTPLTTELDRRHATDTLTIHRPRYQDVTATIDLGGDYDQSVTLVPIAEAAPARPSAEHASAAAHSPHDTRHAAPASPGKDAHDAKDDDDCQPPDRYNPFERACHGRVCRPCPVASK